MASSMSHTAMGWLVKKCPVTYHLCCAMAYADDETKRWIWEGMNPDQKVLAKRARDFEKNRIENLKEELGR